MINREFCDLCNSSYQMFITLFNKNNFTIVRCKKCDFVFTKEVPEEYELKEAYSKNYYTGEVYHDYLGKLYENRKAFFNN